ncbi:VOC family protein [Achromobacter deleyi]|uniref:VOC family protein n=1 Tax=Achromobacter deleyi TaxID=1353891 RepID=UPI0014931DE2|nr:VOC family protein [Achromobacter deleyi]QVQ28146.1 VOC family protein [Achromobacter deleyi]UIP18335.1 VOC family protein [Achromobacter deleyi]
MTLRIDHVVIQAGQELDEAQARFRRLGFQLTDRGHHSLGSSNHLAIFGDDYLELIGVEASKADIPGARWEHPLGLAGLVFKTGNADATWADLAGRRVPLEGDGPRSFHRPVSAGSQLLGDARFRTLRIQADRVPNGRVFFCQHQTPELVWRPEWQQHPNGALGIAEYTYITPDPQACATLLEQAFGPGAAHPVQDGVAISAGRASVLYQTVAGIRTRFGLDASALLANGERAAALTLRTDTLARVQGVLEGAGVEHLVHKTRIVVPPTETGGLILAFVSP